MMNMHRSIFLIVPLTAILAATTTATVASAHYRSSSTHIDKQQSPNTIPVLAAVRVVRVVVD
ncbi:MAG: hypothetical protein WCF23_22870 [Candidatus Nitrosopolaris sp.]